MQKTILKQLLLRQIFVFLLISLIGIGQSVKERKIEAALSKEIATCQSLSFQKTEHELTKTSSRVRSMEVDSIESPLPCNMTTDDYDLLLRLVEAEAGGEPYDGKVLVANVVFNRVKSAKFPSSVKNVILQQDAGGAQFSPVRDGRIQRVKVQNQTKKAVEDALHGLDFSNGALYFVARAKARPDRLAWFDSHLEFIKTCGGHSFYK